MAQLSLGTRESKTSEAPDEARNIRCLLDRIHQRGQPLNSNFEPVSRFNRSHTTGRARQNYIPREQGHVHRNKAHQMKTIENQLAGVRVLPELPILEKLEIGR